MCPLCGQSHDQQAVVTRHVFGSTNRSNAFFHCKTCDVRYQHPGLTSEEEAKFYAMEFEGFMASRAGHKGGWLEAERHISANESTRLRRMNYLTPHLEGVSSILEIGCSSGFMLYPLVESGYTCTGIEPSGIFSKFITERGLGNFRSIDELEIKVPKSKFDLQLIL
jgi:SAM-dependent methyltransferase